MMDIESTSLWARIIGRRKGEKARAFTLLELLVVVAVVVLLTGILLPSLQHARELTRRVGCAANLHGIGRGLHIYAHDNNGHLPGHRTWDTTATLWKEDIPTSYFEMLSAMVPRYTNSSGVYSCPNSAISSKGFDPNEKAFSSNITCYVYTGSYTSYHPESPLKLPPGDDKVKTLLCDPIIKARDPYIDGQDRAGTYYGLWHLRNRSSEFQAEGLFWTRSEPPGGNELYTDGSTRWVFFSDMQHRMTFDKKDYDYWW